MRAAEEPFAVPFPLPSSPERSPIFLIVLMA